MRSKVITSDTQIATSKITILGYQLYPDGTNAVTAILYNEADSSKTAAAKISSALTPGTVSKEVWFEEPLVCSAGLYVDISGTNGVVFIFIK